MEELGFEGVEGLSWRAKGCMVSLYACFGKFEIDITLPNGTRVSFDVPIKDFRA
jgi:hypothetical protein